MRISMQSIAHLNSGHRTDGFFVRGGMAHRSGDACDVRKVVLEACRRAEKV